MNFFAAFAQPSLLHGRVVDRVNGQPLSCANISLLKNEIIVESALTDSNGNFILNNYSLDTCSIKIEYLGFISSSFILYAFTTDTIQVELVSTSFELPELTVVSETPQVKNPGIDSYSNYMYKEVQVKVVKYSRGLMPKGGVPQFVAMHVPAVYAKDGGEDGKLYFAGSRSDANQYKIDGVIVIGDPHIPLCTLQSINVVSLGTPANYGDFTGGLIEINTKSAFGF